MKRSFLQRLFGFWKRSGDPELPSDNELDWLMPPSDVHDQEAWNQHWKNQVSHGLGPPLFDMFCDDEGLVRVMLERGMTTVLCAGTGISQEPRALAEAGFQVTALDSSRVAIELAQAGNFTAEQVQRFFPLELRRPGGSVTFTVGDLLDPTASPGPFDVVVERCTLQLFPPDEQSSAIDALAHRLKPDGIFLSHCHHGGWRPEQERVHFLKPVFVAKGWTIESSDEAPRSRGRVARLFFSSG